MRETDTSVPYIPTRRKRSSAYQAQLKKAALIRPGLVIYPFGQVESFSEHVKIMQEKRDGDSK